MIEETYTETHVFIGRGNTPDEATTEAVRAANDALNSEPSRTAYLAISTQFLPFDGWIYVLTIVRNYQA